MGLGAWLAAETERAHYHVEEDRERREVQEMPQAEEEEIYEIFEVYGIARDAVVPLVTHLKANEDMWVKVSSSSKFLPQFHLERMFLSVAPICLFSAHSSSFSEWRYQSLGSIANTTCSS